MTIEGKDKGEGPKETEIDWGGSLSKGRDMPDFINSPLDQIKSWLEGAFSFLGAERIQTMLERIKTVRQEKTPGDDPKP